MARRTGRTKNRSAIRGPSSGEPLTLARALPQGPVAIDTGTAEVVPDPDHSARLTLHVNGVPSSCLDLADPGFLAFEYMQQMDAVLAATSTGPVRALHLGAAGCALARAWDAARPGSRQLAVDVDARLVALVREWFDLPRAPRLRLRADDAAVAVAGAFPGSWDVVVRDVFSGDTTPAHLVDAQAARHVTAALRPGGLYLVNCADRPPLDHVRRELATLRATFGPDTISEGRLALVAEPGILKARRYGNLVLAAVAPATSDEGTGSAPPAEAPDLRTPGLARALRALPVPAQVVTGAELERFVGTARPY